MASPAATAEWELNENIGLIPPTTSHPMWMLITINAMLALTFCSATSDTKLKGKLNVHYSFLKVHVAPVSHLLTQQAEKGWIPLWKAGVKRKPCSLLRFSNTLTQRVGTVGYKILSKGSEHCALSSCILACEGDVPKAFGTIGLHTALGSILPR